LLGAKLKEDILPPQALQCAVMLEVMTALMTVGVNRPIKEKCSISVTEFFPAAGS
jgi:hypothetical protein